MSLNFWPLFIQQIDGGAFGQLCKESLYEMFQLTFVPLPKLNDIERRVKEFSFQVRIGNFADPTPQFFKLAIEHFGDTSSLRLKRMS